jgi:anti-sigma regulatory factor (Ser/Thr protein kinase)
MPANPSSAPPSRLTLQSQLDDLARVWPWIETLSGAHGIPENTQFAVQLCLEEALSNIIRHGYRNRPGESVTVDCALDENRELTLTVEDQGPPFDPLTAPEAEEPIDHLKPGGRGIRLMRRFAGSLSYQRLPSGNRLTMRFALPR